MIRIRFRLWILGWIVAMIANSALLLAQQNAKPADMDVVNADPLENQRLAQMRQHVKAQLSFIKSAVELSDQQIEELAGFNDEWLRTVAGDVAKNQTGSANLGNALVRAFGGGAAIPVQLAATRDPILRKATAAIDKKIDEMLTSQQREQVKLEREARRDFQSQALAELTVAIIERQIHLSDEQAQQLVPALTGKLNANCGWNVYLSNPQYIPVFPKAILSRVLSGDQLKLLGSLNQQDFLGNNLGLEQMFGIRVEAEE